MKQIEILNKETIDQIAAGEVVERPASVVKELVENAIDAGADAVTVEIREGGRRLIRVTDNGEGIPADQIRNAFMRHATSKIRNAGDLIGLRSLGFRGEALSSIAAVAMVECITKTEEDLTGIRYCTEGGKETCFEEVGAPSGTTFLVRDLFFNTPVRAKFMKTAATEGTYVRTVVESLAVSHPQIAFTFLHDGRTRLVTDGSGEIRPILYQIFGRDLVRNLIPFHGEENGIVIDGLLGTAVCARGNRNGELFFVNGRPVKDGILSGAAEEGYHGYLMQHRYPFILLSLEADGRIVDVNVHPTKQEVRFSDREQVFRLVSRTVRDTLHAGEHIPEASPGKEETKVMPDMGGVETPEPFETVRRETAVRPVYETARQEFPLPHRPEPPRPETGVGMVRETPEQQELFREDPVLSKQARRMHRLIGQVFGTYWLIEYNDMLYIIDQHAAHEKVLFERMMKQYREKKVTSQMLFPSVVIEPGSAVSEQLREKIPVFRELGYEIEEFGGNAFKITAVPANLYQKDVRELFTDILDQMQDTGEMPAGSLTERIASMSCKAAVKGNTVLSPSEADALIDELLELEDPYHCPHGRPVIIRMSRYEMDRKFKRII